MFGLVGMFTNVGQMEKADGIFPETSVIELVSSFNYLRLTINRKLWVLTYNVIN